MSKQRRGDPAAAPRILIYGAGVIGSLFASRLHRAGQDVTLLARRDRFAEVQEHGLILEDRASGERTVARVKAVERLNAEDRYDLVLVVVRKNQVDAILPSLAAAHHASTICFMVNTAAGYAKWAEAVGVQRLMLGFPGAGGGRIGPVVRYTIAPAWMQRTTFGEPDGRMTARLRAVRRMFRLAGLPAAASADMSSWLTSHVALVSPFANGLYLAGGDSFRLARQPETLKLVIEGIREGFSAVRAAGMTVTPAKLRLLEIAPTPLLSRVLRAWIESHNFQTIAASHAIAASDEMRLLAREFLELARSTGLRTPAIDALRQGAETYRPEAGNRGGPRPE